MVLKKQTVWLLSMLTIMVVLSAYYLIQGPSEQVPVTMDENKQNAQQMIPSVDTTQVTKETEVQPTEEVSLRSSGDFFIEYRMMRDNMISKQMNEYMDIIAASDASTEAIADAKKKLDELQSLQDAELQLEQLIKAQGFPQAVVISKDNRVNVIVQAQTLSKKQVNEIIQLVSQNMNIPGVNVTVSYKK